MATKETLSRSAFEVAQKIDHTLLRPDATAPEISKLCEEAKSLSLFSVCINPCFVSQAFELLRQSPVKVCTVIGFPLGASETQVKSFEAECAVRLGADELDMVINIGALKNRDFDLVLNDIRAVVGASQGRPVKTILETSLLTRDEKIAACKIAMEAGASFVKTSTGFSGGGATVEDVMLMREVVGENFGVKASGGIRDLATALKMIQAGANRLGTSQSLQILTSSESNDSKGGY